jgi:hypothetical protein
MLCASIQDNSVFFDEDSKPQATADQDLEDVELGTVERADGWNQDEVQQRHKLIFQVVCGCFALAIIGVYFWLGIWFFGDKTKTTSKSSTDFSLKQSLPGSLVDLAAFSGVYLATGNDGTLQVFARSLDPSNPRYSSFQAVGQPLSFLKESHHPAELSENGSDLALINRYSVVELWEYNRTSENWVAKEDMPEITGTTIAMTYDASVLVVAKEFAIETYVNEGGNWTLVAWSPLEDGVEGLELTNDGQSLLVWTTKGISVSYRNNEDTFLELETQVWNLAEKLVDASISPEFGGIIAVATPTQVEVYATDCSLADCKLKLENGDHPILAETNFTITSVSMSNKDELVVGSVAADGTGTVRYFMSGKFDNYWKQVGPTLCGAPILFGKTTAISSSTLAVGSEDAHDGYNQVHIYDVVNINFE